MKKYYVCQAKPGTDSYQKVKKFKNERDAISFIEDGKNICQYIQPFLRMEDGDNAYIWNESKRQWEAA